MTDFKDRVDKMQVKIRRIFSFFKDPVLLISGIIIGLVLFAAVFPGVISPYGPSEMRLTHRLNAPGSEHFMGTDEFGRDTFTRVIYGAQVSVYVGIVAVVLAGILGILIGTLSGFAGGLIDSILMRIIDAMLAFPPILFALVLITLLGPALSSLMLTMGIVYSPRMARLARGCILMVKNELYVESARAIGASNLRIIFRYFIPNIINPIIVQASLILPVAILAEATLSFLGLGIQPPTPSWGNMLSAGRGYMEIAPWLTIFPGIAIALVVLAVNFLGDALQDWLNPRLRFKRAAPKK